MFKKTLLVGAIALAASGAALADGFYVGAGVGGTGFHSKDTDQDSGNSIDFGNLGLTGGVFAGYGFNFANQMNLGVEAFGNATSAKASVTAEDGSTASLKSRYNYGLRVLPGYAVTPDTTVYGIVGYVRGNFKAEDQNDGYSKTFNANGYQLGLGSATNVAKNVAIRGDVIYSGYQSKTVAHEDKFQNNTLDGVVSVAYKFG